MAVHKNFCCYPGCSELVRGRFCGEHQPSARQRKANKTSLSEYGKATWKRVTTTFRQAHPICEWCAEQNQSKPAQVVDHIIPAVVDFELFYCEDNLQSLCHACHNTKTQFHEPFTIYDVREAHEEPRLIILGKPGTGKTTFARQRGGWTWDWDRIYGALRFVEWKLKPETEITEEDWKVMFRIRDAIISTLAEAVAEEKVTVIFTNRWRAYDFATTLRAKVFQMVGPGAEKKPG